MMGLSRGHYDCGGRRASCDGGFSDIGVSGSKIVLGWGSSIGDFGNNTNLLRWNLKLVYDS